MRNSDVHQPDQGNLLSESGGAEYFGGAVGGNGKTDFYRNRNIAIETTFNTGGGLDVGWMQPSEWFERGNVPLNSHPYFLARIATPNAGRTAHFVIDGVVEPSQTLPNTGGWQTWVTYDLAHTAHARIPTARFALCSMTAV